MIETYGVVFYGVDLPFFDMDMDALNADWEAFTFPHRKPCIDDSKTASAAEWDQFKRDLDRHTKLRSAWRSSNQCIEINWCGDVELGEKARSYFLHCPSLAKWIDDSVVLPLDFEPVNSGVNENLIEFCDRFNLPKRKPRWHLGVKIY